MRTTATKRYILPFSPPKNSPPDIEAAAVFAVAEFKRNKGGGLIARQPEEKLAAIAKIGYPLWLYPKNDSIFLFDGFGDSSYTVPYTELPSAKTFTENLEANSRPQEKFAAFLSDHSGYFQEPTKEKQFMLRGLFADLEFKSEFNVYRKEATETPPQTNVAVFSPSLEENAISSMLVEFDKLKSTLKEEAERLQECAKLVSLTTSQYITELDYEAAAVKDEAYAKIRAQEEIVKPKITQLTKNYRTKIKNLTETFDQEIEKLQKLKMKTQKLIEANEEKISLYLREAKDQAEKNHAIYEKRWKEKTKQTKKEQGGLKKELKNAENNIKKLSKLKRQEISRLNFGLDDEIKFARQPLLNLEAARDAKVVAFKLETDKLLKQEKPVIEGLNRSLKLREAINANFEGLGIQVQGLKNPGLFHVPFYVACFEAGSSRRYLIIPPSTINGVDFSAQLKGALGMSKIKDLLAPRFEAITALIDKVQTLTKQNAMFAGQLESLAQKNNLLSNSIFRENVVKGLVYLKHEGWLSEREHQDLSSRLTL
jgi:hypothetical protein